MVQSRHSHGLKADFRGWKETSASNGNQRSLLETLRPNGFDQCLSCLPSDPGPESGLTKKSALVSRSARHMNPGALNLTTQLDDFHRRFEAAVARAADARELDDVRVAFLGRSGEVTQLRRSIGQLPDAERPNAGKVINEAVKRMEHALGVAQARIENSAFEDELAQKIDVTFPSIA